MIVDFSLFCTPLLLVFSIFSKLNNLIVCTVLSKQYASYFGLTERETSTLLEHYDLELNEAVKSYYDGYCFAGIDIYNPWSILSYASEKIRKPYWLKTSTNALITESVLGASHLFHRDFEKLIEHGLVKVNLNLETSFAELPRASTLWGLFVNAGYVTVTEIDYELEQFTVRIPNREIVSEFKGIVSAHVKLSSDLLQLIIEDKFTNRRRMMANIRERIIGAVSVMDDKRAMRLWNDIQNLYSHNYDVVHATPEEIEALDAYERGDEEYQPSISLDDLARELLE